MISLGTKSITNFYMQFRYSNYGEKRSKSEYLLNKHKKFFKASKIFEEQFPPPCLENPTIFLSQ